MSQQEGSQYEDRLERVLLQIDTINQEDPHQEYFNGQAFPKEWLYGQRMSRWLERLHADAPESLQIAARAQHIRRWVIPRDTYPNDRTGYLRWRKDLYKFHADTTADVMRPAGYDEDSIERVRFLLLKKSIKSDADSQTLEDCACLVFLEHHLLDFAQKTDEQKLVNILRQTWKKMSPQAQGHALTLHFTPDLHRLLTIAVAEQPQPSAESGGEADPADEPSYEE
jgi:hypothetical protein